jgi:hypothetical protein
MNLDDPWIEFGCMERYPGPLPCGHRHDNVVRIEFLVPCSYHESPSVSREPVHFDPMSDREIKMMGVSLEVVGHLIFGWEGMARSREGEAGQAIEATWGEQPQRVPPVAPRVPDSLVGIHDQELKSLPK